MWSSWEAAQQPHLRRLTGQIRPLRGGVRAPQRVLRRQLLETPPTAPHRMRNLSSTFKLGRRFLKLDEAVQRDIHELFTRSAGDLLDHRFETDAVKALYGFDAAPRHDSGRITQLSRQRQLTLPPLSVSIFPTNSRAAAIGIRNARVQQTSSSRRSSRTRPINAPASSATRP